ncbi:hypothetical protein RAH32_08915 [Paracoccus sp. WLY502]|nr:hypothetical protein [Paracoccus sp. WLY502]MDQ1900564.1 hypothetical protein [Paracoccus sp. WLY502]
MNRIQARLMSIIPLGLALPACHVGVQGDKAAAAGIRQGCLH